MLRGVAFGVLFCACGDNATLRRDAGADGRDASVEVLVDADVDAPPVTGFTIGGTALGVRGTVLLSLTTDTDTRHAVINADGAFVFPGRVPAGSNIAVTTATTSCEVTGGTATGVAADITTVQLVCEGVVELAGVTFASGVPAFAFSSVLVPAFDPGASVYTGTRPFFMDDTDLISVTPTAAYPALPSIDVYTDPTTSGQAAPPHVLGAAVPVRLQYPTAFDRTYQFTLLPGTPAETAFLKASSPVAYDSFGSVALSGDVLVVGAPGRGGTGAAFVYRRSATGWTEEQILQPTADAGARAGAAVAIDGDVLVIGAPSDAADNSGRAYVYRHDTTSGSWVLDGGGTLAATTPQLAASCGNGVAVSGPQIVIGCPAEKPKANATDAGAAYMFRYDTTSSAWVPDGTFKGTNANDQLGAAVALSGGSALVGAPYEDDGTTLDAGGVHVLVRGASTWSQQGTTFRGAPVAYAHFGSAVAISGDYGVVGAPDTNASTGAAYIFRRVAGAWSLDGPTLVRSEPDAARFGEAVAIDGTHVVIGAPVAGTAIASGGAVYAYRREIAGWTERRTVVASNPSLSRFGQSVTVDGEWFAAGAPEEGSIAAVSGAVYVFR